ncbi:hypothetical protein N7451_003626 [Penicillium sp. IBT 35674x]|nr:hypothetical protein N7451_003626 [Penicillium sp. IBT 35674x]
MAFILSSWVPDPAHIAVTFSSLGVLFHISIIPFEIDTKIHYFLGLYTLVWTWLVTAFVKAFDMTVLIAILKASLAGASFLAALGISMVVYRFLFHRVRHFPGPLWAKISRFPVIFDVQKSGFKYHQELKRLHRRYGDFVRVDVVSLISIRDHDIHRKRRKLWEKGLGMKAVADYIPRILSKTDLFMKRLGEHDGKSIDITQWSLLYTFDIMGLIAFSKDYKQLDNSAEHYAIAAMHAQMDMTALVTPIPWVMYVLGCIPGMKTPLDHFTDYSASQMNERRAEWHRNTKERPIDIVSWLIQGMDNRDPSAPPTDTALYDDGRLAIIAGSDTTGATLANIVYYLTSNPKVYQRLQKEVDEVISTGGDASQIPYIDAIINETLRLKPAVPGGMGRITPPEGLTIDEVFIPGNIIVIVPQHVVQRDERNFERASEFLPERWMDEGREMHKDERAFFPFSLGHYACVGKQLAMVQLRLTLQRIASEFDLEFAPGGSHERYDEGAKDTFTLNCPPLNMIFKKRSISNQFS